MAQDLASNPGARLEGAPGPGARASPPGLLAPTPCLVGRTDGGGHLVISLGQRELRAEREEGSRQRRNTQWLCGSSRKERRALSPIEPRATQEGCSSRQFLKSGGTASRFTASLTPALCCRLCCSLFCALRSKPKSPADRASCVSATPAVAGLERWPLVCLLWRHYHYQATGALACCARQPDRLPCHRQTACWCPSLLLLLSHCQLQHNCLNSTGQPPRTTIGRAVMPSVRALGRKPATLTWHDGAVEHHNGGRHFRPNQQSPEWRSHTAMQRPPPRACPAGQSTATQPNPAKQKMCT